MVLKKNYVAWFVVILLLALTPVLIKDVYAIHVLNLIGIYILHAMGMNLLLGFCGQFNLGQAGFYGIGAYTSVLLVMKVGISFWIALPLAGFAALLLSFGLGPTLKLPGHCLAMATLAFGEIIRIILLNWTSLTNGPTGIINVPYPKIGSFAFNNDHRFFYLIYICVVFCYFVIVRVIHSRVGRSMRSIRDDEVAAESLGVDVTRYRVMALLIAAFFAGVAGSLYAHLSSFISPHSFHWDETVKILTMLVVGGAGHLWGSVIGVVVLTVASEALEFLEKYRLIFYSGLMIVILIFAQDGLYGIYLGAKRRIGQFLGLPERSES